MSEEQSTPRIGIAFEHFEYDQPPKVVWKVTWIRILLRSNGKTKKMKCSDWFNSEESAWDFVTRKLGPLREIVAVQKFVQDKTEIPKAE